MSEKKTRFEIFALIAAGVFAFFTWGIDQLLLRQPSWGLSIENINEVLLEYNGKVSCTYEGVVTIENKSKLPLSLNDTTIEFYLFDRPGFIGTADTTGYIYEKLICTKEKNKDCTKPFHTTEIGELDDSAVFPGTTAGRPFSISFSPHTSQEEIESFLYNKVLLTRVIQGIEVETTYFFTKSMDARVNLLDPNICNIGLQLPSHNKSMQPTAKASAD